jgi:putative phosphoesterase
MLRLVKKTAKLAMRADGTLKIAAVSDTHSQPHAATRDHLRELAPDAILHAGDIGDANVIEQLAEVAPVFVVRGNIDTRTTFPDVMTVDLVHHGTDELRLRIFLTHIAVNGPKLRADVARLALETSSSLVVCGHSHVPFISQERGLTVFNPGSIGPRRFHLPIVFGTIVVTASAVRLAHVNCETGQPWSPP